MAVARKGGRYNPYHSNSSDEQSNPILAATANSVSMSAGRNTISSGLLLHFLQLENVHYVGGVVWMLIPDDKGELHISILNEISPPVTRDVAADVHLNLYTKYVQFVCRSSKLNLKDCPVRTRHVTKTPQTLVGVPVNIRHM